MRLSQYLALCGICSRRQASRLIEAQRIEFLGRIATHTDHLVTPFQTQETETIRFDGAPISAPESKQYWLYHKPVGIDCKLNADDPSSLIHHLPTAPRLYPAGRLDKDSRGLLLLSNDGELTQKLMHPDYQHTKTYQVQVDRPFADNFVIQMAQGVQYQQAGKPIKTRPCLCQQLSADSFEITLTQGMNRQIRRMCQALGYRVIDLKRIALMDLKLGNLRAGSRRELTPDELQQLIKNVKSVT